MGENIEGFMDLPSLEERFIDYCFGKVNLDREGDDDM